MTTLVRSSTRQDDEDGRDLYEYPRARREPHCKCGNPDLPGSCPGWRNCPMCQDDNTEEEN